jgi:hypothetical protein
MIRENDLHEAIAECIGKRNPDASTCIKLAAYYTILNQLYPQEQDAQEFRESPVIPAQSFAVDPDSVQYEGDSEFAQVIRGRSVSHIMPIIDEAMQTIQVLQPRLYDAVIRRIMDE